MKTWLEALGSLRLALCAMVLALTLVAPLSGGQPRYEGIAFIITVLAPSLFVMFAFILALDILMTRVFMSDKTGAQRTRLRRVLWVECVLLVAMLGAWAPLVVRLLGTRG